MQDLQLVQALAVVGEGNKQPFEAGASEAAEMEAAEAENLLDDAEYRLDGLLATFVFGTAGFTVHLHFHLNQPVLHRLLRAWPGW